MSNAYSKKKLNFPWSRSLFWYDIFHSRSWNPNPPAPTAPSARNPSMITLNMSATRHMKKTVKKPIIASSSVTSSKISEPRTPKAGSKGHPQSSPMITRLKRWSKIGWKREECTLIFDLEWKVLQLYRQPLSVFAKTTFQAQTAAFFNKKTRRLRTKPKGNEQASVFIF